MASTRWGVAHVLFLQVFVGHYASSALANEPRVDVNATESLAVAERAFQGVDFSATYEAACGALERGGADVQQTVRLHVLCGISAAALDKSEDARRHFIVALAIRPELRLERDLSPKIRGPYLEAQGAWAGVTDRLSLKTENRNDSSRLHFKISDPGHLSVKLKAYVRELNKAAFRSITVEPHPTTSTPVSSDFVQTGYDYYAVLVDAQGNSLAELGSEADPFAVRSALTPTEKKAGDHTTTARSLSEATEKSHSRWLPITLLTTGIVSAGAGIYFNVKREDAAATWNGPGCEQAGLTRMAQCANINADRLHAERAAIGLYAAGGLLVAGAVTLWALDGPKHADATNAASQPASVVACGATLALNGLSCSGSF